MSHLVWIDLETTGVNPERDAILALGVVVTDWDLGIKASGEFHVWQPAYVLELMSPVVRAMHQKSGLLERVAGGEELARVERRVAGLIPREGEAMLAGSSVHFDRRFLARHMPALDRLLHYRHLDVSVLSTLAYRWEPALLPSLPEAKHTPMADLERSMAILRHFRSLFARPPDNGGGG